MVHGTMYDPEGDGLNNPHLTIYEVLRNAFAPFESISGIGWPSVSFTPGNLFEAWFKGHLTWYGLAVRNARLVSPPLSRLLSSLDGPYAIVCHSIGCDIARHAVSSAQRQPARILLINPDTDYAAFQEWSIAHGIPTLHVAAKRDSVLRFSQYARKNSKFQVAPRQDFYSMETINFDQFLPDGQRDSFSYGNPRRLWDHMASLEVPELWLRYREFLKF
ncbi:alpha/beta hydrolase [Pelagibius sp. Alg239-R121]|uniref:alpha/beta hydrolase n=1 Tax=Pelagibius sp. Alg239-R121 TaxID=2993448 RepID=UPI0024A71ECB|nr:alpha/beta hydrolase [Pelagibius sp. Alg239-R121]